MYSSTYTLVKTVYQNCPWLFDHVQSVLSAFESGGEETKAAAAFALGNISVGNMKEYLPVVFDALGSGKNEVNFIFMAC